MARTSQFTESQMREIIWAGLDTACLACTCCIYGITEGTWYRWRRALGLAKFSRRDKVSVLQQQAQDLQAHAQRLARELDQLTRLEAAQWAQEGSHATQ